MAIDTQAVGDSIKSVLDERLSGYALVGFIAGCDQPVMIINSDGSELKRLALISKLHEAEMELWAAGDPPFE